jgi:hypothetical protein
MSTFSTRQAAKALSIDDGIFSQYKRRENSCAPLRQQRGMTIHLWTNADIERVRQLLPKIAKGRKTRRN